MKKRIIVFVSLLALLLIGILLWNSRENQEEGRRSITYSSETSVTTELGGTEEISSSISTENTPIQLEIDGEILDAYLYDNTAAQDLTNHLPITLTFRNFSAGYEEKIGDLPDSLSIDGMSEGDDPTPGDIGYWSPQPRVVLYWGDVSYFSGIHVIGRFQDVDYATQLIENQEEDFDVTMFLEE